MLLGTIWLNRWTCDYWMLIGNITDAYQWQYLGNIKGVAGPGRTLRATPYLSGPTGIEGLAGPVGPQGVKGDPVAPGRAGSGRCGRCPLASAGATVWPGHRRRGATGCTRSHWSAWHGCNRAG